MTGCESLSLGAEAYREYPMDAGLYHPREYDGEGQNHYYHSRKPEIVPAAVLA